MAPGYTLFRDAAFRWSEHNAPRLGAALAFYTVLSLAPLLVILVAIGGFAFGEQAVRGEIFWQIRSMVGDDGAQLVQTLLKTAHRPETGLIAGSVGIIILFAGASAVFLELRETLNYIWGGPGSNSARSDSAIRNAVRQRCFAFAIVLGIGFLLIVSITVSAVMQYFSILPAPVLEAINVLVTFGSMSFLFALMYRVIPEVRVDWEDVAIGSLLTAALFAGGRYLIGLYLGKASVGSAYGAAGSLVVLLVWVYYSSQIFLYGAEFTRLYADRRVRRGLRPPVK
jgi:membrane protein